MDEIGEARPPGESPLRFLRPLFRKPSSTLAGLSFVAWLVAQTLPVFSFVDGVAIRGYYLTGLGWVSFSLSPTLFAGWTANAWWLAGLVILVAGSARGAFRVAILAELTALLGVWELANVREVQVGQWSTPFVRNLEIGALVWLASVTLLAAAAWWGVREAGRPARPD